MSADRRHGTSEDLAAALLAGDVAIALARNCGVGIAASYFIVAVSIPGGRPGDAESERVVGRLRGVLAGWFGGNVLSLLSPLGGTVLIPVESGTDEGLDIRLAQLSTVARFTAAVVSAAPGQIPSAARRAHELLELAVEFGRPGRVYRFADLALEYQLTRPGPGRERLAALLEPLGEYPELLETLRLHLCENLGRQRLARRLHIHPNTLDYRFKRIARQTGLDPTHPIGQWYLRSAFVAEVGSRNPAIRSDGAPPGSATA
ncbi:PucR family transcriptional regulator [Nocardia alni]|uniref:PucR family transcriptional regulator n=1 Tax=Nocardia alni TaxID=2815723 RepID=UPI001C24C51F|nr:helix-turn-helix domain-containing protein [Nocardia alni]